jgi:UDP:flavonoid glycosyltransferase YjiC (YdhE family)
MEFAGQLAAEEQNIPHVTVGIGALDMAGFRPQLLIDNLNATRSRLGLDALTGVPWRHRTQFVTAVPKLLWYSADDVPADALLYRHEDAEGARPTGVTAPSSHGARKRVYATLGSVAGGFEWAARVYPPVLAALGQVDADVLFTIGKLDPASLGPVPANVKVERYVPQEVAMACDAVVIHAGAGTTVAALSRGLPIVAVPIFADQPHNAAKIAAAGAGLAIDVPHGISELPAAVTRVLQDPSFAAVARGIAHDMAALPTAADVLAQLRPVTVH